MSSVGPDHYFSAQPSVADERREIQVRLAGRDLRVSTSAGTFSPSRLDPGTAVLLDVVPAPTGRGSLLDLGCGWGPIAITMGLRSPFAQVWGVDVNQRALDLARANAGVAGVTATFAIPEDVPRELTFDEIWSNPPIHIGKPALHALLRTWLPRLVPGGRAHLVVQKHLGADSLQAWISAELGLPCQRIASRKGFRVLRVERTDRIADRIAD